MQKIHTFFMPLKEHLQLVIILPRVIFPKHQVLEILLATGPKSNGFWSILIFYDNNMI